MMFAKHSFFSLLTLALPILALPSPLRVRQDANTTLPAPAGNSTNKFPNGIATAWYPGWMSGQLAPADVPWDKYNAMTFAFALTTPEGTLSLDDQSKAVLPTFVAEAKKNNVKALLSLGGWTGSIFFSPAVDSAANRTRFAQDVLNLAKTYELDGIDFDWEYPNKQGIGCNILNPADSANFLSLLQEIRADPAGSNLILSAAVGLTPFAGPDGTPLADVSDFAKQLDFIAIMAYDVWGSWSTSGAGPNAPLDDSCAPIAQGSGISAVDAWTAAGFPSNQITLGVASYGRAYTVANAEASKIGNYPAFDTANIPLGESDTGVPSVDQCGNTVGNSGLFNFNGMIKAGFLSANGTAAPGMTYEFDTCSQTPFVYNPTSQVMVSYDDATSFAAKGEYIADKNLAGFAMWHIAGDSDDILIDAIRETAFGATTPGNGTDSGSGTGNGGDTGRGCRVPVPTSSTIPTSTTIPTSSIIPTSSPSPAAPASGSYY